MGNKPYKPIVVDAAERLTPASIETLKARFMLLTQRNDVVGTLQKKDFVAGLAATGSLKSAGEDVQRRIFQVADTKCKDKLNFEDFVRLMYILGVGTEDEQLRLIFNLYDLDASSFISAKHFKRLTNILMLSGEPPSWKVDFGKLEDGTQDILDVGIGEFSPLLQLLQDTAFHVYDEDGDGKLSFDEWRSYAAESAEIKTLLQMIQAEAVASSQSMWSGLSLKSSWQSP